MKLQYNHTKIVATMGPASAKKEVLTEMIKAGVSILVPSGAAAIDAAVAAAKGVPIVFVGNWTTVGQIKSLARPGGVTTGTL